MVPLIPTDIVCNSINGLMKLWFADSTPAYKLFSFPYNWKEYKKKLWNIKINDILVHILSISTKIKRSMVVVQEYSLKQRACFLYEDGNKR